MVPMQDTIQETYTFHQSIFNSSSSPTTLEENLNLSSSPQKIFNNSNSFKINNNNHGGPFFDDDFSHFSSSPIRSKNSPLKFNYQDNIISNNGNSNLTNQPLTPNRTFNDSWINTSSTLSLSQSPSTDLLFNTPMLNLDNNNNNNHNSNSNISTTIMTTQYLEKHQPIKKKPITNLPNLNNLTCKYCKIKMKPKYLSLDETFFMCGTNGCVYPLDDENMCDFIFPSYLFKKKPRSISTSNGK